MVEIAVCPYSSYHTLKSSVQEIRDQYPKETIPVARYSPISKTEFKDWSQYWPINYHPTELERNREKGLDEAELAAITKFRKRLESDNENIAAMSDSNFLHHAAILVNPITQEILATSKRAYEELILRYGKEYVYHHPLITPTMVCINHIANIVSGIIPPEDGHVPSDQYLCTGLNIYIYREGDLMSSMALVHSRIRRVYFIQPDTHEGALSSGNGHIHQLRALNHHYRVFQLMY